MQQSSLVILSATAMLFGAVFAAGLVGHGTSAAELRDREGHLFENTAGVAVGRLKAFLVGNGVLGSRNEILTGAYKSDDRENTEGNAQIAFAAVAKLARKAGNDRQGNVAAGANTVAGTLFVRDLDTENDGIDYLDNGGR